MFYSFFWGGDFLNSYNTIIVTNTLMVSMLYMQ